MVLKNKKLAKSHSNVKEETALARSKSIIDQPFTIVASKIVEWEKNRDGPMTTKMISFAKSNCNITDGYTVSANSRGYYGWGNFESAKADCVLKSGRWYFEVNLKSNGQLFVGFCTPDYDPSVKPFFEQNIHPFVS